MLVKKGQNIKMCYLHNKNDIHISSAYTCSSKLLYIHQDCYTYIKTVIHTSRLLYIHQNSPYTYQSSYLHVERCYTYIKII